MEGLLTAGAAAATPPVSLSSPQLSDAREQTHSCDLCLNETPSLDPDNPQTVTKQLLRNP